MDRIDRINKIDRIAKIDRIDKNRWKRNNKNVVEKNPQTKL
jgi:hypothetical protein